MAESAFSEDGKYYSAITQDGRLRIWDTETNVLKQEYTPDLHLSSPLSCLQWISVSHSTRTFQKSKRKSSISDQEFKCVALGTTSGKILIYSIAEAKAETVLEEKNEDLRRKNITCLDWHRRYGLLSCNKDNIVYDWDLSSATVRNKYNINVDSKNKQASGVSAIKIVPHSQKTPAKFLVTASWQVRIWRLHSGAAVVVKNLGHNSTPRALLTLASLHDRSWLIEGSQNERLLSFWDVTITSRDTPQLNGEDVSPNKKQRKKSISEASVVTTPSYNFVLEDAPKILDVAIKDDNGTKLTLAAATRSGVVHYYGHMLNGSSTKPIKPSVTIQVTTGDARPMPLQCCHLPPDGDILLGYSNGPALMFEKVAPDLKSKTQVLIREDGKSTGKKVKQTDEATKVRSDKHNEEVAYVEPMGGVSRKRPTPGAKVEVPMEARLENLSLDLTSRSKSAVNQNLTKLLVQGLHSKDKGLILTVLQKDEPEVALRTVSGLPPDYVPQLLAELADMATRKTSQCAAACTWAHAALRCHAALLLATSHQPSADHLTQLLAIFTHRRSHLCQLLNLKGRLELTIAQRSTTAAGADQEPLLNYNDTSSDEEMELEGYKSDNSGVESWGDKLESEDGSAGSAGDSALSGDSDGSGD